MSALPAELGNGGATLEVTGGVAEAAMLTFTGGLATTAATSDVALAVAGRLHKRKPGVGWNAVHIAGAGGSFGTDCAGVNYYLDFSALSVGDPDQDGEFRQTSHQGPVVITSGASLYK